jgi:phosphoenolpyruvate-protein kinase (PTS system EI component)
MASSLIPRAKAIIRTWSASLAREITSEVLDLNSAEEVRQFVRNFSRSAEEKAKS